MHCHDDDCHVQLLNHATSHLQVTCKALCTHVYRIKISVVLYCSWAAIITHRCILCAWRSLHAQGTLSLHEWTELLGKNWLCTIYTAVLVDSYTLEFPLGEYFWFKNLIRANGVNGVKKGAREVSMSLWKVNHLEVDPMDASSAHFNKQTLASFFCQKGSSMVFVGS